MQVKPPTCGGMAWSPILSGDLPPPTHSGKALPFPVTQKTAAPPPTARRRARQAPPPPRPAALTPPPQPGLPSRPRLTAALSPPLTAARSRAPRRGPPGPTPVSARRPLAAPPRDPCPVRARPAPRHLTQRSPNAQCGRPGSRGAAAAAAAGGGGRGGPSRRPGRPGEYAEGGPPRGGLAPAPLRQWWLPGRATQGARARQLGTRPEATGPAGRSHWAECAGGPLLRKALGAQLGGGGEGPAPTPGPGAPAVPAPPEIPRGPGQGATAVAGPPSDRCRRPLPAAGIALSPGKPGARKFLEQLTRLALFLRCRF
ncbi:translation initiation factor IF-2-like [Cervus elaphus]|uniref:translation initiation factor IF-2-like n=1 Tax=Cervus elaphus TaxID=9860 RepID=UPI001CC2A99B|nr:translation initiation factor IF-2-like [Cervus elaphus]